MAATAIVHADTDGKISSWNSGAEELFGYSSAEAVGKALDLVVPERFRSDHWRGFTAAVERRSTSQNEPFVLPILCKDGSERAFAGRLFFLCDAYDRAVGAMGVFVLDDTSMGEGLYRL